MNTCTSDRCKQGREKCPCPEACELPIQFADDEPIPPSFALALWITGCITLLALASFIVGYVS